jgi:hypothetical protein
MGPVALAAKPRRECVRPRAGVSHRPSFLARFSPLSRDPVFGVFVVFVEPFWREAVVSMGPGCGTDFVQLWGLTDRLAIAEIRAVPRQIPGQSSATTRAGFRLFA